MRPLPHAVAAAAAAPLVFATTHSAPAAAIFALSSIFVDLDHLIDFLLWEKKPIDFRRFLLPGVASTWPRVSFVFHGHEWVAIALLISAKSHNLLAIAFAAGWAFHMLLDETGNRMPWCRTRIFPLFYFFTYRLLNGFNRSRISFYRHTPERNQTSAP